MKNNSRASVETLHGLPQVGKEQVQASRKLLDITSQISSLEPTRAALGDNKWRCINLPNSGNPKLQSETSDTPSIGEVKRASELGYKRADRHDCLYTYTMCTRCSRTRWVRNQDLKTTKGGLCRSCSHTTTKAFRNYIERVTESGAKRASELGKAYSKSRNPWYYPHLCSSCGKQVWHQRKDLGRVCKECGYKVRRTPRGEAHRNWAGGRYVTPDGYVVVQLQPDNPYYAMADSRGCVLEHRLVVADAIGRCLVDGEVIHHINGVKTDNRIENLELLPNNASHMPYNLLQKRLNNLQHIIEEQKTRIKLLEWRVGELEHGNPELAGDANHRASVETLQEAPLIQEDEEKVRSRRKLGG